MVLVSGFTNTVHASSRSAIPAGWHTFTDPVYHFRISYPPSWILTPGYDGSHITLGNPQTATALSVLVSTVQESPEQALAKNTPAPADQARDHSTFTFTQIAGHPALDVFYPYIRPAQQYIQNGGSGLSAHRGIVMAIRNSAGTTNVYSFLTELLVDRIGQMTPAADVDNQTVTRILGTFTLPTTISPAPAGAPSLASPGPYAIIGGGGGSCDAVCWADGNWNYNKYNDASALYCTQSDGYSGTYGSYTCGNNNNLYGVTPPSTGYYQPYFQCAEFVARALSEQGDIPGLRNGGLGGLSSPTPTTGSYSYGNFPMTYMGGSYSSNTTYALTFTGNGSSTKGLYDYLTNTSLGVLLSPMTLSGAVPGDVVFFSTGSSFSLSAVEHVMIIVSTSGSDTTTYMDGHNVDDFHATLRSYENTGFKYQVMHLRNNKGAFGTPTLSGSWNATTDGYGQSVHWAYTGCSTCNTAGAQFTWNSGLQCAVAIYVPSGNATAQVYFGVYNTGGGSVRRLVNENLIDGWALLYKYGELNSTYETINVSNNTGTSGQQLGVGEEAFMC